MSGQPENESERAFGRSVGGRRRRAAPRAAFARCLGAFVVLVATGALAESAAPPGPNASLAEIEACVSRNLPEPAGVIEFAVDAVDRTGAVTASRAEIRWRTDDASRSRIVLRVAAPEKVAGTALLVIDRAAEQPEFFLRLPDLGRVKKVRSKRLRGPVLGTDFSYEDLDRLRDPIDPTALELVGVAEVDGRPTWLLETRPEPRSGSEYARVLTHVDQDVCLPIRVELYGEDDRLRKRLVAPLEDVRPVADGHLPHRFVMEDLRRGTHTIVRIERFAPSADLPAAQFTRRALEDEAPPAVPR